MKHSMHYNNPNAFDTSGYKNKTQYTEGKTADGTVVNPKGTVYLEANSATGSKFYNLITAKQDFISERGQTWTPSYSVVNVTDDSFEVTIYDADTGKVLDGSSTYKIVKKAEDTKKDDTKVQATIK